MPLWPQKPKLLPEVMAEFELHGIDALRSFLAGQGSYKGIGTERDTAYRYGNAVVKRGEIEDWLKWKDDQNSARSRMNVALTAIGVVIAAIAAILAGLSWLAPIK